MNHMQLTALGAGSGSKTLDSSMSNSEASIESSMAGVSERRRADVG